MLRLTAFGGSFVSSKVTVKSHSTEMLQREQIIRGKEHWPSKCVVRRAFSLFTCLATPQQRLVTSPRDPGVLSSHVNAGQFSTKARRLPHLPGVPHLHVNRSLIYQDEVKMNVHHCFNVIHVRIRACLHGGGGPQVGEVTRLGGVTRLSIYTVISYVYLIMFTW